MRHGSIVHGGTVDREGQYTLCLEWIKTSTRLKLKVAMDDYLIEGLPSDPDDVFDEYDEITRQGRQPERGPVQDYIVSVVQYI